MPITTNDSEAFNLAKKLMTYLVKTGSFRISGIKSLLLNVRDLEFTFS